MSEGPLVGRLAGLGLSDWKQALDEIGEERGHYQPLGPDHAAIFTDQSPVLLVTFETVAEVRARPDRAPLGWALADPQGLSQLTILADSETWFRDRFVYGYFDRLIDDGFFEDFDRVVFLGAGMCGHAACAFSVAAPGATVLAVQPVATLDPERAGWDRRHVAGRRFDFRTRYGYAPQMIEAADRCFVFFDPEVDADAIHASFFVCDNVVPVRMRRFGTSLLTDLQRMGVMAGFVVQAATADGLTARHVHRALRARRDHLPYLRTLVTRLAVARQWLRLSVVTRALRDRFGARRFGRMHADAVRRTGADGRGRPARSRGVPG